MSQSIVDDIDITLGNNAKLKVIGVGGGGGNAVQNMIMAGLKGPVCRGCSSSAPIPICRP